MLLFLGVLSTASGPLTGKHMVCMAACVRGRQSGLREVHRSIRTQEARVIFVAPNIEPSPVGHGRALVSRSCSPLAARVPHLSWISTSIQKQGGSRAAAAGVAMCGTSGPVL